MSDDPDKMEFNQFLEDLVKADYLEDPARGITKLVIDKGGGVLSTKQESIFQREIIEEYVHERCDACHQKIP